MAHSRASLFFVLVAGVLLAQGPSRAAAQDEANAAPAASTEPGAVREECRPGSWGCFRDADGAWRNAESAYHGLLARRRVNHLRNAAEMGAIVLIGTLWYWIDHDRNAVDWDYNSWRNRLTADAFRYDNNTIQLNFVYHPIAGAAYYGLSRSNGLGVLGSSATSFLSSFIWEYLFEFKERVSVNDLIVTPGAGVPAGEFFHRLGQYLNSSPGRRGKRQRSMGWAFGLPVAFHRWRDDDALQLTDPHADERGYGSDVAAELRLSSGGVFAHAGTGSGFGLASLHFEGAFSAIPGYLREGAFRRPFADGNFSSMRFMGTFGAEGTGVELFSEATIAGLYQQELRRDGPGLRGYAATVGMNMDYLFRRQTYDTFADDLGVFGFPGPALDLHYGFGRGLLHFGVRAHVDFAGVRAAAYPAWEATHSAEVAKSTLRNHGYHFAWGGSGRILADVAFPYVSLGGSLRYGYYDSREGLDRAQEMITVDVNAIDRALDAYGWIRFASKSGIFVEASVTGQRRWSFVGGDRADTMLLRTALELGIRR